MNKIEKIGKYDKIIVTGSQRSGTRIMAHIIAEYHDFEYIDESHFHVHNEAIFEDIVNHKNKFVIQAPGMCHIVDKIVNGRKNILVVYMLRNLHDVLASQKRIGWGENEMIELRKYGFVSKSMPIYLVKFLYFQQQKKYIPSFVFFQYESLKQNPLFVPKEKREFFKSNQWKI